MSAVLAIVASSGEYRCALRHGDGAQATTLVNAPSPTKRDLAPIVAELCERAGIAPEGVDEVRLDVGPGSYTGLRVAITFARMLGAFGTCAVRCTTSLALHALAAWRRLPIPAMAPLCVVLDARRDRFHRARFARDASLRTLLEPRAVLRTELAGDLARGDVVLASPALAAALRPEFDAAQVLVHPLPELAATDLFDPALPLVAADLATLEPLYLMGTYVDPA